jgi:hypothetical protein
LSKLASYTDVIQPMLSHLIGFLQKAYCREALVHHCMSRPPGSAFAHYFSQFQSNIIEWRWGSLIAAIDELLPLQNPLQRLWNTEELNVVFGRSTKRSGDQTDIAQISAAIKSAFVWAYLQMMQLVAGVLITLSALGESCYCHSSNILSSFRMSPHYRRKALQADSDGNVCPGRGQRAADFASGRAVTFLEELMAVCEAEVLKLSNGLSPEERSR